VPAPTLVLPPTGVVFDQITAGGAHNCASDNGVVYCWGDNALGQLGAGTGPAQRLPARIKIPPILKPTIFSRLMIEISAEANNTCAVDRFSEFFCWGALVSSATPQQITSTAGLAQPFVKAQAGDLFACTGASGAPPACFGANNFGQLGDGTNWPEMAAVMMAGPPLSSLSLGSDFGCGIDAAAGDVVCWGYNGAGQLGNGTGTNSNVPVVVQNSGSFGAVGVAAGQDSACAISAAAAVLCWGSNHTTPILIAGGWNIQ
jgi:alpha-tubulin suppressor-like RCC1 family protein